MNKIEKIKELIEKHDDDGLFEYPEEALSEAIDYGAQQERERFVSFIKQSIEEDWAHEFSGWSNNSRALNSFLESKGILSAPKDSVE
jgi:hypothetical protein